ncbi:MAG TPA: hypothetical protein VFS10_06220 [Pyrinomonadaceae bacterium]|nr:hypothetical protein [Pyrinomonadaceae bacterium]
MSSFLKIIFAVCLLCAALCASAGAQTARQQRLDEEEFGPVVRAYLGYLRDQQEVVDDRVSRREVDRRYYARNSNRIRALREMAVRMARASGNDYLPELEAVALDEFDQLFAEPLPRPSDLRLGETLYYQFRFLGTVPVSRDRFYLFARLDPYEQAELRKKDEALKASAPAAGAASATTTPAASDAHSRPRRVNDP